MSDLSKEDLEAIQRAADKALMDEFGQARYILMPQPARTCDACRHWDGADDVLIYGSCMNHKLADQESRADVAESAEFGIDGYLLTGPKFGCVHWEAKAPTPPPPTPS